MVTDHNAGPCRVSAPTLDGAGRIVHPELPSGTEERTCLGGLLRNAREGADAAGSPALVDPTPGKPGSGDEVVLVPDGATKQKALWRAQWNKRTHRFDPLDTFDGPPADIDERGPRPTAAAVGPDGNVYYLTKTADWIVQVRNPASETPSARIVGYTSDGEGAESIAVGGTAASPMVYLAEATGLTRVRPATTGLPETRPATTAFAATAVTLPGLDPAVTAIGAVAFDRARQHLYVGTAAAALETDIGTDRVRRYLREGSETSPTFTQVGNAFGRFSTVGGLGLRPDGRLLVADDPAIVTPGEPLGIGRLTQLGAPAARIASGPSNLANTTARIAGVTTNPTPSFTLEGDAALRCWLRKADTPAGTAPTWVDCGTTFAPASALADGKWLLTVQSTVGTADANIAETLPFEVDTVALMKPSVTGVSPVTGGTTSAAPTFTFAAGAGDAGRIVAWTCRLNDKPEAECKPGRTFPLVGGESQLNDGQNELVITAIDRAGRKSPASDVFRFRADAVRPRIAFSAPAADQRQTSRTVAFSFSAGENDATYGCRLDGAPFRRCNVTGGPGLPVSSQQAADGTVTVTYAGLSDGAHTLEVHAQDRHGTSRATSAAR